MPFEKLAPNPCYGSGSFLRWIEIRRIDATTIHFALEDLFHAFELSFTHDDKRVTSLSAAWRRNPYTSCAGAPDALRVVEGSLLTGDLNALAMTTDPRHQCTHLFDAMRLGILHVFHGREDRRYEVLVADETTAGQAVSLSMNGELRRSLTLRNFVVTHPETLAGAPILRGFAGWAKGRVSDEEYEELFIIQRAVFVSAGRRIDVPRYVGKPASIMGPRAGSCFASQPGLYETAVRPASSLTPEQIRQFRPEPERED